MTTPSTRQRLRELAERAKVDPDPMTAIDPGEFIDLLDRIDRMEAVVRAAETERDTYRAMLCDLLASAHPHPVEHPTMAKQWDRARELLKNGPNLASAGSEEG